MLNALKRWLGGPGPVVDLASVEAWALGRGYQLRRDRESLKVLMEGDYDGERWRLEYGPPQRAYIDGLELRMRMELHLPPTLNVLLMTRVLKDKLETAAFERFTKRVETHIDTASPEEMRWLAMYPKVALPSSPPLKQHFGMVSNAPHAASGWVQGPLGERLSVQAVSTLEGVPFVLMTLRGRLYLRMRLPKLPLSLLEEVVELFRLAAERAKEAMLAWEEDSDGSWMSTTSIAWQHDSHIELPLDSQPPPVKPPK
ncbi:hypothetical protein OOT46_08325 [Aquabacterium sp. A7-Y]|uniref:hypothetical protein n=1 Tax=Aquabacterium sp. A7-Y TaxID=1349605 RepID=UPI00223CA512|nr:hypothetical protein [Aquabacterium sp. A7-Y]MCW7537852.1 hypothetical protein [Aquabacterium sp. A7-Y]